MPDQVPPVVPTGMTERALFCMLPEAQGGCEETNDLIPIHHKIVDGNGVVSSDVILGWLCKGHALSLAMHKGRLENI